MSIECHTPSAVFLVGVVDDRGVMHFLNDQKATPGVTLSVAGGQDLNKVLNDYLNEHFRAGDEIVSQIRADFHTELDLDDGPGTLFVGGVVNSLDLSVDVMQLPTLPALLRAMPKDRLRLPYLRAWQMMQGVGADEIDAVEFDDNGVLK